MAWGVNQCEYERVSFFLQAAPANEFFQLHAQQRQSTSSPVTMFWNTTQRISAHMLGSCFADGCVQLSSSSGGNTYIKSKVSIYKAGLMRLHQKLYHS
jgi:hypothetical protein